MKEQLPDEEIQEDEKVEPADPVNDPKEVKIVLAEGKLVLPFKNAKKCRLFRDICMDSNFEDIPKLAHEDWAVKKMGEFLIHYDSIKTPPVKHPARRKELTDLKHLAPFLKPDELKNPPEWQATLLNLISYCTTEAKEGQGEDVLDDWLARYLNSMTMAEHSAMIKLADFVDCKVLHDFLCASFALKYLISLSVGDMRKVLKVEDDFSEDEKNKLHYHFVWDKLIDWKAMKVPTAPPEEKKKD
jgi:hypothetical protein